ncbi:hypothetical protein GLYMA_10G123600v4 [Glycine max]|uniref:Uncharacterized protein n=1 Tax=Glycine max TaxID=3847 RepID=K7LIZ3_SOYBN|nr:hypothetical protein GLYMA_10G123600v4 [Glycine max]KAG4397334.1 hypothetical protein GLYMA_10G123600v4 [Glycine max]KAH1137910.1 hypothetical protein GYH30_027771 [Glycine max]KAH1137912.1 hypothetical protein GYH30_027771 [Glycine max]KAH1137917.1 hypothetical protein GYH30_027771 [Glycine max]
MQRTECMLVISPRKGFTIGSINLSMQPHVSNWWQLHLIKSIETAVPKSPPTLNAFACFALACLKGLQNIALKEEASTSNVDGVTTPTLLGLANSLSRSFIFARQLKMSGLYLLGMVLTPPNVICSKPNSTDFY